MPRSKNSPKRKKKTRQSQSIFLNKILVGAACLAVLYVTGVVYGIIFPFQNPFALHVVRDFVVAPPTLNKKLYNQEILSLANNPYATSSTTIASTTPVWPVDTVYPDVGAILPSHRIVTYYGNFYSKQMGVLGEYPPKKVLSMLMKEVSKWRAADPNIPVIPAIEYIAVTAQGAPGPDKKYRLRMPASQIEKTIQMAGEVHGLVFLDVQVGLSNLQTEIPLLKKYLRLPQVELAIDPEFSMKDGRTPGTVIGTFDASDINYAARYLAQLVDKYHLPPKILVVHLFTKAMVTNYKEIRPLPEVQIIMDMDGWGLPKRKLNIYHDVISSEPVQFTGIKIFYKNDLRKPGSYLLTPKELLKLNPIPIYIQYQ